jgi:dicarboxylate transporter 10
MYSVPITITQGPLIVLKDLLSKEGPKALFRGWVPAWLRMAPTTTLTFVFMEKLRVLYQAAAV